MMTSIANSHYTLARRSVIGGGLMAVAAMGTAQAQTPAANSQRAYAVKPLAFDPQKIPGLSEKILVSHYENNYTGAVRRLNAITEQLAALDYAKATVFTINGLKREELVAANSMILHELYFDSLGGGGAPDGALAEAVARDFGGVDKWRAEFAATGKALGGGSGWVLLSYSPRDRRLINQWAADHTMSLAGATPILALDMYEHAYAMDFGAKAAAYVDAVMGTLNWAGAARRYAAATRA